MKNKLILLGLIAVIIGLILTQVLKSGTEHVEVVDTAIELKVSNDKLVEENNELESDVKSLEKEITTTELALEATPTVQEVEVIKRIKVYIHDTVVVHDTVYIKEQKNFWGKTKSDTL